MSVLNVEIVESWETKRDRIENLLRWNDSRTNRSAYNDTQGAVIANPI